MKRKIKRNMARKQKPKSNVSSNPQETKVPKKLKREMEVYNSGLSNLLHNKKTREDVQELLKSAPPETSIPKSVLIVNDRMETALQERKKLPSLEVRLGGGVFLVNELIDIGNEGGFFQLDKEQAFGPILQTAMQEYIETGIKKGTVDPIELQALVEPLMSEEQRAEGLQAGGELGVPGEAGSVAAMETYGNKRVATEKKRMEGKMNDKGPQTPQGSQGPQGSAPQQQQPQQPQQSPQQGALASAEDASQNGGRV